MPLSFDQIFVALFNFYTFGYRYEFLQFSCLTLLRQVFVLLFPEPLFGVLESIVAGDSWACIRSDAINFIDHHNIISLVDPYNMQVIILLQLFRCLIDALSIETVDHYFFIEVY